MKNDVIGQCYFCEEAVKRNDVKMLIRKKSDGKRYIICLDCVIHPNKKYSKER